MDKEILVIRGNITPSFNRFEELVKAREERERLEREEKWKKEREEREQKEADWKKEHPILDKFTYLSYYNYETYGWNGYLIDVYFYEWSDINSNPRKFPYSTEFYKFLDACKINLTQEQNDLFRGKSGCHITCIPGTHNLIVSKTYDELKVEYEKASVLSKVLESVPEPESETPKVLSCMVCNYPKTYA